MRIVAALLTMGVFVLAGCGKTEPSCSPAKEIATSSVVRTGNGWDVTITSLVEAPVDKVVEAASHPDRGHELLPDSVLKSEIIKDDGNTKVVDLVARVETLPPGFKVQNIRTEYTYYPQDKRFTTKSIEFKLADITSEYKFAPSADGKGTQVTMTQQYKGISPLPESVQKGAICETFTFQVKIMRRALGLDKPAT